MEFSELFCFVVILNESFFLLPKIWKFTLPTALISVTLPSFFFLLYRLFDKIMMDMAFVGNESVYIYIIGFIAMFIFEIIFLFMFIVALRVSMASTTIVAAVAYTGQTISTSHLLTSVRKTWRKPGMRISNGASVKSIILSFLVGGLTVAVIIMDLINPISICLLVVLWIGMLIMSLKSSVGGILVRVVSVLEEASDGSKAIERSEQLVEGQRLKGFMMSLFCNILICVCFLVFWMIIEDKGIMNLTIYGVFFVAIMPILAIFFSVMHTVFYFQCKKHRGEEVDVLDLVQYTKLPSSA